MQRGEPWDTSGSSSAQVQGARQVVAAGGLSATERWAVLIAAFLGWMLAGLEISLFVLIARPAMRDMLGPQASEAEIGQWFAWFQCAFLLGAAAGGWLFGWLGDRFGRSQAMAGSILCYSMLTGISYFAADPYSLLLLRFVACLGIGGVWPNAVSLSVEALPNVSRALLAGLMGAAANVGFVLLGLLGYWIAITPDDWRWVLVVGASPVVLGLIVFWKLPESPSWLAGRTLLPGQSKSRPLHEILRPPLLRRTVIGICLGAVPVIGTSANANWLIPWADQAASPDRQPGSPDANIAPSKVAAASGARTGDPRLKALTQVTRSGGAVVGSLLGGWLAGLLGRRVTYFFISLLSFFLSSYIYQYLDPFHPQFKTFTFLLGFVGVTYFGWLPLYLPELFPTRVRSTGTGVTFNSGRVLAAASVLGAGQLMHVFGGDYAQVGTWTGFVYVLGMVVICFAPDTTSKRVED